MRGCSRPFSTNCREVMTSFNSAARRAASIAAGPAEKLSIAGTRLPACNAKKVTTAAIVLGRSTPTRSPGLVRLASGRPSAKAPRMISR